MTAMEPIDVVRAIYDAGARKDFDEYFRLIDPAVVVEQDPALPWGGRYEGHAGLAQLGTTLREHVESAVTTESMFEAGEHVVQHGRTRGRVHATGAAFDIAECHVWRVVDGRAVEARFFIDSAAMLRALGGG